MKCFKAFLCEKRSNLRAGLLPYYIRDNRLYFALMIPSDPEFGGSSPQIAKGGVESGEDPKLTAIREAEEELGFVNKKHYRVQPGMTTKQGMYIYYVQVDDDKFKKPGPETKKVVWLESGQVFKQIRGWQKGIFGKIFWKIRKEHGI